jgi:hypothetical protein
MIRSFYVKIGAALLAASVISGCASAEPSSVNYIRQDGQQIIRVDRAESSIKFTGIGSAKSDFGGVIKECNVADIRCLNLSGYFLSAPQSGSVLNAWSAGGADFAVVGRADRGTEAVWLIQVSVKGDKYMFYTFSKERGVESISLQQEGVTPDLAKTYFLVGEQGLLAGTAEAKSVHP